MHQTAHCKLNPVYLQGSHSRSNWKLGTIFQSWTKTRIYDFGRETWENELKLFTIDSRGGEISMKRPAFADLRSIPDLDEICIMCYINSKCYI